MGTITLVVLGLTLAGMAFGALFGFLRGRDRALLRLILIIISAVLALALRGTIIDAVTNININGVNLEETISDNFGSGDSSATQGIMNLIVVIFEIIIGFVSYFILLFALRFLTWLLVFPFLKLFIRKFGSEPGEKRGQGALVGLTQGILLSYFLFAPLTCLLTQVNQFANIKMGDETLFNIPEETGITEYTESAIGQFYNATGRWYYNIMTTATDANGNKVSLENTLNSVSIIMEVVNTATSLKDDIDIINKEDVSPEEIISSLNNLGDKLISIGTSMEQIDDNTKTMMEDLIKDIKGEDASQEEIDEMLDMLSSDFFTQAGNAMKSYAEYEQIKLEGTELTQQQANDIVDKTYISISLVDEIEFNAKEEDKPMFKIAIDSRTDISAEDKDTLYRIFGIQTSSEQ